MIFIEKFSLVVIILIVASAIGTRIEGWLSGTTLIAYSLTLLIWSAVFILYPKGIKK